MPFSMRFRRPIKISFRASRVPYRAPAHEWGPWVEVASHVKATAYTISADCVTATVPVEGMVRYTGPERSTTTRFADFVRIVTAEAIGKVEIRFRSIYMPTDVIASVRSNRAKGRAQTRRSID